MGQSLAGHLRGGEGKQEAVELFHLGEKLTNEVINMASKRRNPVAIALQKRHGAGVKREPNTRMLRSRRVCRGPIDWNAVMEEVSHSNAALEEGVER